MPQLTLTALLPSEDLSSQATKKGTSQIVRNLTQQANVSAVMPISKFNIKADASLNLTAVSSNQAKSVLSAMLIM